MKQKSAIDDVMSLEADMAAMVITDWCSVRYPDHKIFLDNLVWRILKEPQFEASVIKIIGEWEVIRFCYLRWGQSGVRGMKRQNRIARVRNERRRSRRHP